MLQQCRNAVFRWISWLPIVSCNIGFDHHVRQREANEVGRLCSKSRQNRLLPYYLLACEKAPHFRRTKRTRECENERRSSERRRKTSFPHISLPRLLSRATHAWHLATPLNGNLARRLSYLSLHNYYLLSEAPALILFEGAPSRPAANCIEKHSRCLKAAFCVEF